MKYMSMRMEGKQTTSNLFTRCALIKRGESVAKLQSRAVLEQISQRVSHHINLMHMMLVLEGTFEVFSSLEHAFIEPPQY